MFHTSLLHVQQSVDHHNTQYSTLKTTRKLSNAKTVQHAQEVRVSPSNVAAELQMEHPRNASLVNLARVFQTQLTHQLAFPAMSVERRLYCSSALLLKIVNAENALQITSWSGILMTAWNVSHAVVMSLTMSEWNNVAKILGCQHPNGVNLMRKTNYVPN